MFCRNCGNHMEENAQFCPACGTKVVDDSQSDPFASGEKYGDSTNRGTPNTPPYYQEPVTTTNNILAIVGFVLSFFIPIAGFICSIIAYKNSANYNVQYKGLALAGIIISVCELFLIFVIAIPTSCIVLMSIPYMVY